MVTHRQKQVGIIALAIISLLLFQYSIHQDVRMRNVAERPANHNQRPALLEQLFPPDGTAPMAEGVTSDFYDQLMAELTGLEAGGATTRAASFATETPGATITGAHGSIFDLTSPPAAGLSTFSTESPDEEMPTVRLPTSAWQGEEEETEETTSSESSSTVSASYAVISHLSYETATPHSLEHKYSRALVIARTTKEDISWVDETFGEDPLLQKAIYTVDQPVEPYILPANKGHEVMSYLTFIIDFYDELPEICIFMHAHLIAWHNNELLDMSSAEILKHLNFRKVIRDGYVNLRCHRYPSCPDHLFPIAKNNSDWGVPEEAVFADAWRELLPFEDVPEVVSQPCCGQFAVSRERIRLLPRAQYDHFRRWLMYTTLEDKLSGRVWEYVYQYIWLGVPQLCPKEHACYCDLYGICFGGETAYEDYYAKKAHVDVLRQMSGRQAEAGGNGTWPVDYETMIQLAEQAVKDDLRNAFLRGSDPYNRALEVERPFEEGDGF